MRIPLFLGLAGFMACMVSADSKSTADADKPSASFSPADDSDSWFWFASCDGSDSLTLRVLLDNGALYTRRFKICRLSRDSATDRLQSKTSLAFSFHAPRRLVWWGYRAEEEQAETTATAMAFEMQMWEAGADPDALLIGVVAGAHDGLHMNTIHIAHPGASDTTEVADGLLIVTAPSGRP